MKALRKYKLVIIGFGHAGQTYLQSSLELKSYIDQIFVFDPKIKNSLIEKYKKLKFKNLFFYKKDFRQEIIDKNTILIIAVSADQKIKTLNSLKICPKLIIVEKPPALSQNDFNKIKKKFDKDTIYFALHAAKGAEIDNAKKIIGKLENKELIDLEINQLFTDPYGKSQQKSESLIDSWTDSGLNALSVISEIFGDRIKDLKFYAKKSKLNKSNSITAFFSIPHLKFNYCVTTSWNLGLDLKITQINIPKKRLKLTLDHSKQQIFKGFSTQLFVGKVEKKNKDRLRAHYSKILWESIANFDNSKAHRNIDLIIKNFYSVRRNIR